MLCFFTDQIFTWFNYQGKTFIYDIVSLLILWDLGGEAPQKILESFQAILQLRFVNFSGGLEAEPPGNFWEFSLIWYEGGGSQLNIFWKKSFRRSRKGSMHSSGVVTTFLCEQVTNDVASFGVLLYQRRSQRRPKQKRDPNSTEMHTGASKQTNLGAKRLEGTSWKANTPRPPPTEGRRCWHCTGWASLSNILMAEKARREILILEASVPRKYVTKS